MKIKANIQEPEAKCARKPVATAVRTMGLGRLQSWDLLLPATRAAALRYSGRSHCKLDKPRPPINSRAASGRVKLQ